MKKRTLTIVAVLAAVSMLSFVVFAGNDTYEGYERFKDLLRNEQNVSEHGQGTGTVTIIDNGETVLTVSGEFVGDKESKNGYGQMMITSKDVNKSLDVYSQEKTMYVVDGKNVYTGTHDEEGHDRRNYEGKGFEGTHEFDAKTEAVMDILMGDLKDDFTLEGENIVFELTKEEMPALFNLMTSEKSEHRSEMTENDLEGYPLFDELKVLKDVMPELTETEVDYIKVVVNVENNTVKGLNFTVKVSGKDAAGNAHQVEVQSEVSKSNTLEMKTFELTDEKVYEIMDRR